MIYNKVMMTVGIRQLRQNPTPAINEAKQGRTVTITQRGIPVALLTPPDRHEQSPWEQLIAQGRVRLPRAGLPVLPPPLPTDPSRPSLSEVVQQMRDGER